VVKIRKVRRKNPVLAAEGAVLFLEKVSPALEHVDSSSEAIGNAVNRAIEALVPIIATAPADLARGASVWPTPCLMAYGRTGSVTNPATTSTARRSASHRYWWREDTSSCWSCSTKHRSFGGETGTGEPKALAARGKQTDAIAYPEASRGLKDDRGAIARVCEELLLFMGNAEEAYSRYAIAANRHLIPCDLPSGRTEISGKGLPKNRSAALAPAIPRFKPPLAILCTDAFLIT
jgi:hypothetical protein